MEGISAFGNGSPLNTPTMKSCLDDEVILNTDGTCSDDSTRCSSPRMVLTISYMQKLLYPMFFTVYVSHHKLNDQNIYMMYLCL